MIYGQLIEIAGDLAAGVLLSKIYYWYQPTKQNRTRLTVNRGGFLWVAKTREEWCAECFLTPMQLRGGLDRLQRQGLIELKVMRFGKRAISHIRLNEEILEREIQASASSQQNGYNTQTKNGCFNMHQWLNHPSYRDGQNTQTLIAITTDNKYTTITSDTPAAVAVLNSEKLFTETGKEEGELGNKEKEQVVKIEEIKESGEPKMPTAKEFLALRRATPQQPTKNLAMLWKRKLASLYPEDGFQKDLTMKQRGQLKALEKALVGVGIPGEDGRRVGPLEIVEWAMDNWWDFSSLVASKAGVEYPPNQPEIGFLLKFCDTAANMYLQSIANKGHFTIQPKAKVVESKPETPPEAPAEDEEVAYESPDEIMAFLKLLDGPPAGK